MVVAVVVAAAAVVMVVAIESASEDHASPLHSPSWQVRDLDDLPLDLLDVRPNVLAQARAGYVGNVGGA